MRLAHRIKAAGHSWIEESLRFLESHPEIISLGAGEPDFPAPKNVSVAAKKFLSRGFSHYAPLQGRHELREALAKKLKRENKIHATPEEIIVTCGSKEALLLAMMTTTDPGDEVIVPDPGYVAYRPMAKTLNCVPVPIHLREEDNFEIHPDELKKLITKNTRLITINTPSNPTGTVFSKKILEEIADILVEKNIIALVDEAYEKLIYDGAKHISLASLNGMKDYVITTQTFSKSYAMCGYRVGYAVATEKIIREMKEFKICTTLSAPTAFQLAAIDALKKSEPYVKKMRKEYARRKKLLHKRIDEIPNITHNKPKGAFYFFSNIKETKMSSEKFCNHVLEKAKVILIPGTEFGKFGEGYARISYAAAYDKIGEAMDRIENVLTKI